MFLMFLLGAFICALDNCKPMLHFLIKQKFLYPKDDYLLTLVVVMMMVASAYD